ncbi:helix-turn-helix domain-containing protein [Streptoalloteichus hindustanus]|uniref:Helix-turn-helix domain-containing protein n=1 Tax=Streptoalloteichus hindustanus TaxID=2017 RepID=A0A1M5PCU8_STRHI|nr:helix-turn-helix transcriptional regulator [Streptoalloteichus hindustanus]SHG99596.1 Helix-turn-helix domain-containing protein [Streptoalloteichus hindustanus]
MPDTLDPGIGDRVRVLRKRAGLTQHDLAGAVGLSVETIRKIEQGRRHASVTTLQRIARGLDLDLPSLLGKQPAVPGAPDAGVIAVRHALATVDDLLPVEDVPLPLREAERVVTLAWGSYWGGRFEPLLSLLSDALPSLRVAAHEAGNGDRPAAHELLARLYWVAACVLLRLGQPDAAWLAVRHAMESARHGDDGFLAATIRGHLAGQLLSQGRYDHAYQVATRAARDIEPRGEATPAHLSAYGSLLLTAAVASGRDWRTARADDLLAEASAVAARNGADRNDYETAFGPSQVVMQTVDVRVVTERYPDALAVARRMPADSALPLLARVRHMADCAHAYVRVGDQERALDALLAMERMAPSWIRHQSLPRLVAGELVARQRRIDPRLRSVAQRLGALSPG